MLLHCNLAMSSGVVFVEGGGALQEKFYKDEGEWTKGVMIDAKDECFWRLQLSLCISLM
jgi:hypothetical protein